MIRCEEQLNDIPHTVTLRVRKNVQVVIGFDKRIIVEIARVDAVKRTTKKKRRTGAASRFCYSTAPKNHGLQYLFPKREYPVAPYAALRCGLNMKVSI